MRGWGSVRHSSENSSDFLHLNIPTFVQQGQYSLPSILENIREGEDLKSK